MPEETVKVVPDISTHADEDHKKLTVEITIPGAVKDKIDLRMHDDSFYLFAPREDVERVAYMATTAFCCPVKPEEARAKYENGLLKIEIPFKEAMEDAVKVAVE